MKNFGKCIIFSAPSGSGKTTLVKDLLHKADLNLSFSVSATTRNKRNGDLPFIVANCNKLKKKLLWRPKFNSIQNQGCPIFDKTSIWL